MFAFHFFQIQIHKKKIKNMYKLIKLHQPVYRHIFFQSELD